MFAITRFHCIYLHIPTISHLQLGAGTAVPGITAAKVGARLTTLTDRATSPRLTEALKMACQLNKVPNSTIQIMPLSWGVFSPQLINLQPQDFLLASDCFYESTGWAAYIQYNIVCKTFILVQWFVFHTAFEDILATVSYLMDKNRECKFWTCYQDRRCVCVCVCMCICHTSSVMLSSCSSNRTLWPLLQRWGLKCEIIPLESVQQASLWVKLEGPTPSKLSSTQSLHLWEISCLH